MGVIALALCDERLRLYCKERLRISLDDYEILEAVAKLGDDHGPRVLDLVLPRVDPNTRKRRTRSRTCVVSLAKSMNLASSSYPRSGPGRYVTVMILAVIPVEQATTRRARRALLRAGIW